MKRLKIGIDVDGVCGDFVSRARDIIFRKYGLPAPEAVQTAWGFDSIGCTKEHTDYLWSVIDATPNWWEDHEPLDTTTFLGRMARTHELYFITARQQGAGDPIEIQTANWLQMRFGITFPTVIVTDDKGPLVYALKLDYFIDDRDKNCVDVAFNSSKTKVYLADAPYNKEFNSTLFDFNPITRCYGLDDFFDKIGALDIVTTSRS